MKPYFPSFLILAAAVASLSAQTTFTGGDLLSGSQWSNGLPAEVLPGSINVDGSAEANFAGVLAGVITHSAGTLTVKDFNWFPAGEGNRWVQSGGALVGTGGALLANGGSWTETFTALSPVAIVITGGTVTGMGGVAAVNKGTLEISGGKLTGIGSFGTKESIGYYFLSGGSVTASQAQLGPEQSFKINGTFTITVDLVNATEGFYNILPGWKGSYTIKGFTTAEEWKDLIEKKQLFRLNGKPVKDYTTVFQLNDEMNTLSLIPRDQSGQEEAK